MLLLFHQAASQREAGFIRGGRQGILEGLVLAHLLNEVHLDHGGGQAAAELVVGDVEHLGDVLRVDRVLGGVGIGLGLRLPEHRLHLSGLGSRFLLRDLGRLNTLFRDLHHTIHEKHSLVKKTALETSILGGYLHFRWHGLQHWDDGPFEELVSIGEQVSKLEEVHY